MLKRLDWFIFKSYLGPFVLTFFISVFVLLVQFLWKYVDDFVGKGFEWQLIAELLFYASATFVPMALPLAVLISSLMAFGNLGENYELAAIKASGVSLKRVMAPLVIFTFSLALMAFYFSNNVLPIANLKFRTLLSDVRQQKPAVQIDEGVFYSDISDFVIKIGKKEPDGITIKDIIIYDHTSNNGNKNSTFASKGTMELSADKNYLVFTLFNGYNYDENSKRSQSQNGYFMPMQITYFEREIRRIDLSEFAFKKTDEDFFRSNYEMMNISQLSYYSDSLTKSIDSSLSHFQEHILEDFAFVSNYKRIERDSILIAKFEIAKQQAPDTTRLLSDTNINRIRKIVSIDQLNNQLDEEVEDLPEMQIPTMVDFNKKISENFLLDFSVNDRTRIINNSLVNARNASYQTDILTDNFFSKEKLIVKHKIEWHKKFTLSIACILLFFIGAPLGAIIRKGGLGMPIVVSVVLFVIYHVFSIIGEKSVKEMFVDPYIGMWLASLIYLPVGIFITLKATSDSPLLDKEIWQKSFNRMNIFKRT